MSIEPDRFTLAIESGLYDGVVETVPEGRYRIGSDLSSDIVLVEEGIAPAHLAIGLAGVIARIEALAPGVAVDGVGALEPGRSVEVRLPAGVSIGATHIALASEAQAVDPPPAVLSPKLPPRTMTRALLGLAGAVLVLMIVPNPVADALSRAEGDARAVRPARTAAAPGLPDDGAPGPTATGTRGIVSPAALAARPARAVGVAPQQPMALEPASVAVAVDALREEVERLGLLNVEVEAGSGIVAASGTIEPGAAARWQSVQQWFDERFAGEVTLVNGVSVKAEKLPVALGIEAVWRGEPSHLIIRGQKFLEGAVLEGGWTIQRIEAERVLLERAGRLVAVKY